MKTCLWLTLLSLIAVAYGAIEAPKVDLQKPVLSKEDEAAVMLKAGKSLEYVGRLLQGDASQNKEEKEEMLQVLSALTNGEAALSGEGAEYFLPIIIRGVISGATSLGIMELIKKLG